MATRTRSLFSALAALALVLGSTACAALPGAGDGRAASYLPPDAWLFASLTVRPSVGQLLRVRALQDAFTSQPGFEAAWKDLRAQAQETGGVDFERDVLPLLEGEIALAAFGLPPEEQPRVVVLVRSGDPEKLLRLPVDRQSPATLEKGYKSATFRVTTPGGGAAAAYRGWAILSDSRVVLEQTIDRIEAGGRGGLADAPRFKAMVDLLPVDRLSYGYAEISPRLGSLLADQADPALASRLEDAYGRTAFSVAAIDGGLEMRSEFVPDRPRAAEQANSRGSALAALDQLPATTLVAFAVDSLPRLLADVVRGVEMGLASTSSEQEVPEEARQALDQLTQVFSGDMAVGIGPGTIRNVAGQKDVAVDAHAAARVADLEATIAVLEGLAGQVPDGSAVQRLDDAWWLATNADTAVTYGVDGEYFVVAGGVPEDVFAARSARGFAGNGRFTMVKPALANDGQAFFADLQGLREVAEDLLGASDRARYDAMVRPFVVPLRAYGASTRMEDSGATHGLAILAIRK